MKFNEQMLQFDELFFNEFNGYTIYFIIDKENAPIWLEEMFHPQKDTEQYELSIELISGDERPFVQVSPVSIINNVHTNYDWKDVYVTDEELLFLLDQAQEQINNKKTF